MPAAAYFSGVLHSQAADTALASARACLTSARPSVTQLLLPLLTIKQAVDNEQECCRSCVAHGGDAINIVLVKSSRAQCIKAQSCWLPQLYSVDRIRLKLPEPSTRRKSAG